MRAALVNFVVAVIGFIAGLNGLYWAGGELRPDEIERSFAYYEQNRDRINVVCIGSSRIGRNINPTVFDATMQEHGVETLTINFWAGNMTGAEARFIAEQLVSGDDPPDLLIIESLAADGRIYPNDLTDRTLWWRNIRHTLIAMGGCYRGRRHQTPVPAH